MLVQVRNPLQVLNHHRKSEDPEILVESFKMAYPSASLHPEPINIMASVHCELTVAMHKIRGSVNYFLLIEIGVSKHCCYMCGAFIKKINTNSQKKLFVSGLQGKTYVRWRFPSEAPLDLQRVIMKLGRKEIDELRCFVESKRRSDSFPTADSGDEERAGDWEIDLSSDDAEDFDEV